MFDFPKPTTLIKRLIELSGKQNLTILDFFAGSGTTGHSVLELNKEDRGNRQFILCTNNENSICEEVTYPRISKVINGYINPKGVDVDGISGNLDYYKTDLIPTNGISNITDSTREELTKKAGNMIAIKENAHCMIELCEHYQIFINEATKKQTAIYFTEDLSCFDELIEKTKSHFTKLYIFSFGKIDKSSYKYLGKNYQIEDIPEPIIEIYKEINKEGIL
jgi:adenine-specific DNA-methyltransferase